MTEYLAGKILQSQVEQYTGGVYSLTYSDMKIKWIHPQIILKDVEYGVKEGGVDSVSSSKSTPALSMIKSKVNIGHPYLTAIEI